MRIEAFCTKLLCRRSCDIRPPYTNPNLRRELDVYDQSHRHVGSGHWDYDIQLEDDTKECMAVILMQHSTANRTDLPWWVRESMDGKAKIIYFMLVEERVVDGIKVYKRIGIGQTLDLIDGIIFDVLKIQDMKRDVFIIQ